MRADLQGNNTYALKSRGKQPTIQVMVQTETYRARDDEISGVSLGFPRYIAIN
jgi:hypothetical protein